MHSEYLMGNEAIALGALSAGVGLVCGYPGTPSTEVLETVAANRPDNVYVEWSVNEKAAMEVAAGAAYIFTENLSTALIIAGISFILIFIVHPKTKPFVIIMAIGIGLVLLAALFVLPRITANPDSFRLRRILVWSHPEAYADEGGYQVMQGLYAIGSGGLFGKGLGNSTQKLAALPEAQNDMIFCIICEELGVFGAAIVVILFVFLLYRLFFIARNAPDLLGSLIASGIFVHIALQVMLNIAVVTNLIPTTGITLPFVSYGGTSIVFLMAEMMVALSISGQIRLN